MRAPYPATGPGYPGFPIGHGYRNGASGTLGAMSEMQGNGKVSAREDDALKKATEGMVRSGHSTHAQEWRDPEPSGEDQPDVDAEPNGTMMGGVPDGMTPGDVEDRSDVARYLGRVWPADRDTLLEVARGNEAPDRVLDELERLPAGQRFASLNDAWSTLGHGAEEHRF